MSDIGIIFEWYDLPVIIGFIGWPGLLLGALGGGFLWRRHRIWGVVLGSVAGCLSWATGWYLLA
jgi:Na+/proline symporter